MEGVVIHSPPSDDNSTVPDPVQEMSVVSWVRSPSVIDLKKYQKFIRHRCQKDCLAHCCICFEHPSKLPDNTEKNKLVFPRSCGIHNGKRIKHCICLDCLKKLLEPLCPLCRKRFELKEHV